MRRLLGCLAVVAVAFAPAMGVARAQSGLVGIPVAPAHKGSEAQPRILSDHAGGAFVGFVHADTFLVARLRSDATPDPSWKALVVPKLQIVNPSGTRFAWLRPGTIVAFSDYFNDPYGGLPPPYWYRPSSDTGIVSPDYSGSTLIHYIGGELVEQPNGTVLIVTLGSNSETGFAEFRNGYLVSNGGLVEGFTVPASGTANNTLTGSTCRAVLADGGGAWAVAEVLDGNLIYTDLVAARINMNGTAALTPTSRILTAATRNQRQPALTTDGAGGVFVAWTDGRTLATSDDIYATHLTGTGSLATGWVSGGKVICNAANPQVQPAIVSDAAGGAWIAWTDTRNADSDIYFTHVLGNGTLAAGFASGGAALCGASGGQTEVQLAADGAGGFFALWLDDRDGETDLYGHHVAADGTPVPGWIAGGMPISTDPTLQRTPRLLVMNSHRAIATWSDSRSGQDKVYAAVIASDQVLSAPPRPGSALALRAARAPVQGFVELVLDAASGSPVEVALFDVAGRLVGSRHVPTGGSAMSVRFGEDLAPGLYLARASQAGRHAGCRAIVVR